MPWIGVAQVAPGGADGRRGALQASRQGGASVTQLIGFAPVFVPLLMQVGMSPELTRAACRVGDSVTNGVTRFNP